jgi:hypothetical protein
VLRRGAVGVSGRRRDEGAWEWFVEVFVDVASWFVGFVMLAGIVGFVAYDAIKRRKTVPRKESL